MAPVREIRLSGLVSAFVVGGARVTRRGWSRTALVLLVLLGTVSLPAARAAEPDVASLEREVAALQEVVQRLQAQVDRLESHPTPAEQSTSYAPRSAQPAASEAVSQPVSRATPKAALPAVPIAALESGADPLVTNPQAQLRANWSKIEPGIDSDEVSRLLGAPTKKLRLDGRNAWYYSYPALGNGSVFFTDVGRVSSRQSPFGWGG